MADNRKYYYLKLKEDFFDTDEMKILESMKDGYLYSNILLKLYLKSLSNSGRLMYRNVIPYTPEILATLTGHQVGTVEKALDVFKKLDLIEMLDNGAIYMMDIQNFIGQSSSEADRQREYYNRMKSEKEALAGENTETPELPEPKEPVLPAERKSNKAIGNYTTDFEELWEAYPRKVDKGQAYKKYKARLEDGFSHEQFGFLILSISCREGLPTHFSIPAASSFAPGLFFSTSSARWRRTKTISPASFLAYGDMLSITLSE